MLTIIYKHDHECGRAGETVTDRPTSHQGASFIVTPVCEETMTELKRISMDTY